MPEAGPKERPIETYVQEIGELYNSLLPIEGKPNTHQRLIDDEGAILSIDKNPEAEVFDVRFGGFSYRITQKGVETFRTADIYIGWYYVIPSSFYEVTSLPPIQKNITHELVSWTSRMVSGNVALDFPFQPTYKGESQPRPNS